MAALSKLPQKLVALDDNGNNPLEFADVSPRDLQDDLKAAAVAKATEVKPAIEETGATFDYLSLEERKDLYDSDRILVGRFLEKVWSSGLTHGTVTAREISELIKWDYQVCLRALKELDSYLLEKMPVLEKLFGKTGLGKLLSEFLRLKEEQRRKENNNNSPQSHKKKDGQLTKRGPKTQQFYIPSKHALNSSHKTLTPIAFDMSVLESNWTYKAAIVKMLKFEGKSVHVQLGKAAKELQMSRPTLNKYLDVMNVDHSMPWNIEVEMSPDDVKGLANDAPGQAVRMKKHQQRFGIVRSKETRECRAANLDSILGRVPDRKHYQRTMELTGVGEFKCLPPLEGTLVYDKRIGTVVTDNGGFVYRVKNTR